MQRRFLRGGMGRPAGLVAGMLALLGMLVVAAAPVTAGVPATGGALLNAGLLAAATDVRATARDTRTASRGSPAAQVTVTDAWVPQPPPGAEVAAAYFTLHNGGSRPAVLVEITCPIASAAMLHESRIVAGESQMRPRDRLKIPPGGTVTLRPGALHVMLHGLASALEPGQQVPLVLGFADGREIRVSARVRPLGSE